MATNKAFKDQAEAESAWLVSKTETGYLVLAPDRSGEPYLVTGDSEAAHCSCPGLKMERRKNPDAECEHIRAVHRALRDNAAFEERGNGYAPPTDGGRRDEPPVSVLMSVKRSVSVDGRIDSLSVEFSLPVEGPPEEAAHMAGELMELQAEVVAQFLARTPPRTREHGDGSVPAMLTHIGEAQTRWGWRKYLNFRVDHRDYRLYGKPEKLGAILASIGLSPQVLGEERSPRFDKPCRVVLTPSANGRFTNVERVFGR